MLAFGAADSLGIAGLCAGGGFSLLCVLRAALTHFKGLALAAAAQVVLCLAVILRQFVFLKGSTGVALLQRLNGSKKQQTGGESRVALGIILAALVLGLIARAISMGLV